MSIQHNNFPHNSFGETVVRDIEQTFSTLQEYQHIQTEKIKMPVAKLPLKQRFAEFLFSGNKPYCSITNKSSASAKQQTLPSFNIQRKSEDRFSAKMNALDKFKDISPSLSITIFFDHAVISAGDGNSTRVDSQLDLLLYYLDIQQIPPCLEDILLGTLIKSGSVGYNLGNFFVEGCFCVEILDYRNRHPAYTLGIDGSKKVLLKPCWSSILNDVQIMRDILPTYGLSESEKNRVMTEIERKIVMATSEPLVLEPSCRVLPAMTTFKFNASLLKHESVWQHSTGLSLREPSQLTIRATAKPESCTKFIPKFTCLSVMEEAKISMSNKDLEIVLAEPSSKSSSPKVPSSKLWDGSYQPVMRTIKFEQFSEDKPKTPLHITLYIIAKSLPQGKFDGLLRWGSKPETSVGGWNQQFHIGGVRMVENYISFLKHLLSIQDQSIRLVSDNVNPSAKNFFRSSSGYTSATSPSILQPTMPYQQKASSGHRTPVTVNPTLSAMHFSTQQTSSSSIKKAPTPKNTSATAINPAQNVAQNPIGIAPHLIFSQ